jgi:hypothetical protein
MEAVVHGHEPRRHRGPAHATAVGVERRVRHHPRPSPLISDGGMVATRVGGAVVDGAEGAQGAQISYEGVSASRAGAASAVVDGSEGGGTGAWRQLEQERGGPAGDDERGQMEREQGSPPVVVRSDVG